MTTSPATVTARSLRGPGTPGPSATALDTAHTLLVDGISRLTTSDAWTAMLRTAARFHHYSPTNVLLIVAQRPDATRVAGYRTWQAFGRHVTKGAHGIRILAPLTRTVTDQNSGERLRRVVGWTTATVFDIADTTGDPLPDVNPVLLEGDAPNALWDALARQVAAAGFTLERGDCRPANGITHWATRTITVRADVSAAQACKTLAHELGHGLLHNPDTGEPPPRAICEIEAESVAYLICQAHGITADDYTFAYVAHWADGDVDAVQRTAERVIGCAHAILTATSS